MSSSQTGILGNNRGKIGPVVACTRDGKTYFRIYVIPRNPRTAAQVIQRARYSILGHAISKNYTPVRIGFQNKRTPLGSAYTAAMRANLANGAVTVSGTDVVLDPTRFLISCGPGIAVTATAAVSANNTVTLTWPDNSGISPSTLSTDRVCAALYNPSRYEEYAAYDTDTALRGDETLTFSYPPLWSGDQAHLYIFTASPDGRIVSNSLFVATLQLT